MNDDCLKLTSYFGERHRVGGAFVADALIEEYGRHEIAASILLRGAEGFGLKHHLRTDQSLTLSEDLPLVALTAYGGVEARDAALASGFSAYMRKPYDPRALAALLAGLITANDRA